MGETYDGNGFQSEVETHECPLSHLEHLGRSHVERGQKGGVCFLETGEESEEPEISAS